MDHYPFLTGQVTGYSILDTENGSDSVLHIGVQQGAHITRLLTITPSTPLPYSFSLDLRQAPVNWSGSHDLQIVFELVPEIGVNGYSSSYEFDWIALKGTTVYFPLIIKN